MKKILLAAAALLLLLSSSMYARPSGDAERNSRYEGSVSLTYHPLVSLGVETTHGVRFMNSGMFVGGTAGISFGIPHGLSTYVGVLPRWYFVDAPKIETFLSCGLLYSNYAGRWAGSACPPDQLPAMNYCGGVSLMPELGLSFKLNNGDSIFLAVRGFFSFSLYDSYWGDDRVTRDSAYGYPSIGVGYKF